MQQNGVQGEVNPYHMLLVTYLHVFAPKIYAEIPKTPSFWITKGLDNKTHKNSKKDVSMLTYFNNLLTQYPDKKEILQKVFTLLNPGYQTILIQQQNLSFTDSLYELSKSIHQEFSHQCPKSFFHLKYFYRYFTHQPDTFTIPDKLMYQHIDKLRILASENKAEEVVLFLTLNNVTQLSSYFSYLHNNLPFKGNETIYSTIANGLCLLLNDDNVNLEIKKLIIEEHLPQWIRQRSVSNKLLINMFNQIHGILFKAYIHDTAEENNQKLYTQLQMPLADNYTANDILKEEEKYLEFRLARFLIDAWMRDWQSNGIIVYKEERKNQVIHIFKQSEHYFWLAVGEVLYESINSHFSHILREKTKPWGISTIQQIISSLLKQPHLKRRNELLELQTAVKNLPPEKEAPRYIVN